MRTEATFRLSGVPGKRAFPSSNIATGKAGGMLVSLEAGKPGAIAFSVKAGTILLDYSAILFTEINGQYIFQCTDLNTAPPEIPANAKKAADVHTPPAVPAAGRRNALSGAVMTGGIAYRLLKSNRK